MELPELSVAGVISLLAATKITLAPLRFGVAQATGCALEVGEAVAETTPNSCGCAQPAERPALATNTRRKIRFTGLRAKGEWEWPLSRRGSSKR